MPVRIAMTARRHHLHALLAVLVLTLWLAPHAAQAAQPFGMPTPASAPAASGAAPAPMPESSGGTPLGGILTYAMTVQQTYYRGMAKAFRAVNLEHSLAAAWTLAALSFAYGIFHAVGPGHGKIVVTSYLLADERDVRRGVFIAFLSSFAQAATAIIAVGALAVILGLTHRAVADAVPLIERASFLLVIGLGATMLWRALRRSRHHHDHVHHAGHEHHHDHDHEQDHEHGHHGHAHMPTPQELRTHDDWRSMTAMILAVGLRPCTGAILVLLFALTQGAFLIGALSALAMSVGTAITVSSLAVLTLISKNVALEIASTTDSPWTRRIERGLEIGGGLFILLMGLMMMAGSFFIAQSPLL
jgi:ABC-type nickel/cobalt efflux system permease component RcnA